MGRGRGGQRVGDGAGGRGAGGAEPRGGGAEGGGGELARRPAGDLSGRDPRLRDTGIVLASDVDNPLTGPTGAAAVYGPQKGASPADVATLDAALTRFAEVLTAAVGDRAAGYAAAPGAGAAGGLGYGAMTGLGATFRPGIEVLLDVLGFAPALDRAELVITGEGSLDRQTLHGKAPAGVAAAARAAGRRVVAVCGRLAIDEAALHGAGIARAYPLTDLEPDPARSIANAGPLLEEVARRLAVEELGEELGEQP